MNLFISPSVYLCLSTERWTRCLQRARHWEPHSNLAVLREYIFRFGEGSKSNKINSAYILQPARPWPSWRAITWIIYLGFSKLGFDQNCKWWREQLSCISTAFNLASDRPRLCSFKAWLTALLLLLSLTSPVGRFFIRPDAELLIWIGYKEEDTWETISVGAPEHEAIAPVLK